MGIRGEGLYRYNPITDTWTNSEVAPTWRDEYPQPPDFIDSRPAIMKLTRSIPPENKQALKEKLGFKGYKIGEFGPRQNIPCFTKVGDRSFLSKFLD